MSDVVADASGVIAATPEPPYYAVIFSSLHTGEDEAAYGEMAELMERLASEQPGYLGHESARSEVGITVSYWTDEAAILAWKAHVDHAAARKLGRERWYRSYALRVARVERAYGFSR